MSTYLKSLLKMFSKHGIEVRFEIVKERRLSKQCTVSFGSVNLPVSRSWFAGACYTPLECSKLQQTSFSIQAVKA